MLGSFVGSFCGALAGTVIGWIIAFVYNAVADKRANELEIPEKFWKVGFDVGSSTAGRRAGSELAWGCGAGATGRGIETVLFVGCNRGRRRCSGWESSFCFCFWLGHA